MRLLSLFFCVFLARVALAAPLIWIPDHINNQVLVIDGATNTLINTITTSAAPFNKPYSIAITPDNAFVYIANTGDSNVIVLNFSTYELVTVIDLMYSVNPNSINGMAVSPNGAFIYVTNDPNNGMMTDAGTVCVIDTETKTLIHTITGFKDPFAVAFSKDSAFAYISDTYQNTISKINTANYTQTTPFMGFSYPYYIAVTADGNTAYVSNAESDNLFVLDLVNEMITGVIGLTATMGPAVSFWIALTPDGNTAYVADWSDGVVLVVDLLSMMQISLIDVFQGVTGGPALVLTSSGNDLYCANQPGPVIDISTATNTLVATVLGTEESGSSYFAMAIESAEPEESSAPRSFRRPNNRNNHR